jgi:hypothetical protein
LQANHWSEGLLKQVTWLCGIADYRQAAEALERIGRIMVSDTTIWRRVQESGQKIGEVIERKRIKASTTSARWWDGARKERRPVGRMGAGMDGTMIHIREEGWKELKVGCVFVVEREPTADPLTDEVIDVGHAVHNSYVAHLGGPEVFGEKIWAEAARRGWEEAQDTQVIGDGAPWIWNLALDHFYDSRKVVDWYHASEHLGVAARQIKGEGTVAGQRWFNAQKSILFKGRADRVAQSLEAEAAHQPAAIAQELRKEARYFRNNKRRMNYMEMREEAWVIGSGMIESGAKQYKARFAGSGMRWSRSGAENLLPVRGAILSHNFDDVWRDAYSSPPN